MHKSPSDEYGLPYQLGTHFNIGDTVQIDEGYGANRHLP